MYRDDYYGRNDNRNAHDRAEEDVFSKPVRAGKRTYFFDVKSTKNRNDFYLTITESKIKTDRDGRTMYDKHKVFLYKEDFEKFVEGLNEALDYIRKNCLEEGVSYEQTHEEHADKAPQAHGDDKDIF